MNPNSYDLRLAEYFVLVQPSEKSLVEYYGPVHIATGARVFIPNGGTLLAYTMERVKDRGWYCWTHQRQKQHAAQDDKRRYRRGAWG
jgi:hypothetical protein